MQSWNFISFIYIQRIYKKNLSNTTISQTMISEYKVNKIRRKLANLLLQSREIKEQLQSIKEYHQQKFTFKSLLPIEAKKVLLAIGDRRSLEKENNANIGNRNMREEPEISFRAGYDKENNKNNANISVEKRSVRKNQIDKKSAIRNILEQPTKTNLESLKNQNQLKDLKSTLWMELAEIKKIQRREQTIRKTNEKLKEYNSENRRQYRESLSKDKSNNSSLNKLKDTPILRCQQTESLTESEIQISLPVSLEHNYQKSSKNSETKILSCCKGHEFYEGQVNDKDQPEGTGRLEVCCGQMPLRNINKDIEFYQGQFKSGAFHGFGTVSYKGGVKYVGQFTYGRRQGRGSLYHNGKAETAKWHEDTFVRII